MTLANKGSIFKWVFAQKWVWLGLASLIAVGVWVTVPKEIILTGPTMGTTYTIKLYVPKWYRTTAVKPAVDARLNELTTIFSTYVPDSEISKLNTHVSTEPFLISKEMMAVLSIAKQVYPLTNGKWDPTIKPLVDLWGFSEVKQVGTPSDAQIETAKSTIGFDKIRLTKEAVQKQNPALILDLSSIAKGYAVDQIAKLLSDGGITSAMIEIGGEVVVIGHHPSSKPWRIGISTPDPNSSMTDTVKIISLVNESVATSGDYRIFKENNAHRESHLLDPHTGRPAYTDIVSVSVVASQCAVADALATAIFVGGRDVAKAAMDSKDLEVKTIIMIIQTDAGFEIEELIN